MCAHSSCCQRVKPYKLICTMYMYMYTVLYMYMRERNMMNVTYMCNNVIVYIHILSLRCRKMLCQH